MCWSLLASVCLALMPPTSSQFLSPLTYTSEAGQQGAALELALVWLSLFIHVCVPGEGAHVISRCLVGVRSPILHNSPGSLPAACPHSLPQTGVK